MSYEDGHRWADPVGEGNTDDDIEIPESRYDRLVRLAIALRRLGVSESQTARLIRTYAPDLIEKQLQWLPRRNARKKASLIVSAIDNDYEEPANIEEDGYLSTS